jgi:formamidopyrimidine-DNA glycosylase
MFLLNFTGGRMPELAEVEYGRQVAERALGGKTLASVSVVQDTIVYDGVTPRRFKTKLSGRTVANVCRKGKQLWMEMDRGPHPLFHFGMTGSFAVYRDESERPKFWKVELEAKDGTRLAMINKRRLGRIRLLDSPTEEPPISTLGFDPYLELPSLAAFLEQVRKRKTVIKGLLLNQSFAAGVGNWIADEVLFQAGIDPRRRANELSDTEIKAMRTALKRIVNKAVEVDADDERFPRTWLFHHRWGKVEGARTSKGDPIEFLTVVGRTTAWVPAVQR